MTSSTSSKTTQNHLISESSIMSHDQLRDSIDFDEDGKQNKKRKDRQVPPRPRNCWIIYCSEKRKLLDKSISTTEKTKILAEQWSSEPESVKHYYMDLASKEEEEHRKKYPDYRYIPKKKSKKAINESSQQNTTSSSITANSKNGSTTYHDNEHHESTTPSSTLLPHLNPKIHPDSIHSSFDPSSKKSTSVNKTNVNSFTTTAHHHQSSSTHHNMNIHPFTPPNTPLSCQSLLFSSETDSILLPSPDEVVFALRGANGQKASSSLLNNASDVSSFNSLQFFNEPIFNPTSSILSIPSTSSHMSNNSPSAASPASFTLLMNNHSPMNQTYDYFAPEDMYFPPLNPGTDKRYQSNVITGSTTSTSPFNSVTFSSNDLLRQHPHTTTSSTTSLLFSNTFSPLSEEPIMDFTSDLNQKQQQKQQKHSSDTSCFISGNKSPFESTLEDWTASIQPQQDRPAFIDANSFLLF